MKTKIQAKDQGAEVRTELSHKQGGEVVSAYTARPGTSRLLCTLLPVVPEGAICERPSGSMLMEEIFMYVVFQFKSSP